MYLFTFKKQKNRHKNVTALHSNYQTYGPFPISKPLIFKFKFKATAATYGYYNAL